MNILLRILALFLMTSLASCVVALGNAAIFRGGAVVSEHEQMCPVLEGAIVAQRPRPAARPLSIGRCGEQTAAVAAGSRL